jgi:hypothetical protein
LDRRDREREDRMIGKGKERSRRDSWENDKDGVKGDGAVRDRGRNIGRVTEGETAGKVRKRQKDRDRERYRAGKIPGEKAREGRDTEGEIKRGGGLVILLRAFFLK